LKGVIAKITAELEAKAQFHDEVLTLARRILTLSKQAIMAVHRREGEEAKRKLKDAQTHLQRLETITVNHPDLKRGAVHAAYQEYTEASVFFEVVTRGRYQFPEELGVPSVHYLLGLADVIGEFRRRALDALRGGDLDTSEKSLQIMEDIYVELIALEAAYKVAPELRRKCDVARRIIEVTRGDVTSEARRSALDKTMKRLERRIGVEEDEVQPE
jgi:translin